VTAPLTDAWQAALGGQEDVDRFVGTLEMVEEDL